MSSILTFLENLFAHPAIFIAAFVFISAVLTGIANLLQALGDTIPGWLGTVISFLGNLTHLLNGNPTSASGTSAAPAPATAAQMKAK
jgi:hypothetical protein